MEFRTLGPLEVADGGQLVALRATKPRTLLAVLLVHEGTVVSSDAIIDVLWPADPPPTERKLVHVYVSQLRKAVGAQRIVTGATGYTIKLADDDAFDRNRFEYLVEASRECGPVEAATRLREALALWRGPALADFLYENWAQREAARLEELRLVALERRIAADLELGRHPELVPELEEIVAREPLREGFRRQLMLALYRSGRQAEALEVYRATRQTLLDELGLEPSTELRALEQAILKQDVLLASSAVLPATNLLPPPNELVGRGRELDEVGALLASEDVRLVTLTGPGGSGKTRLAVEVARGLLSSFRDGVFLVELAAVADPALVLPTVAQTFGVHEGAEGSLADALKEFLAAKRLLLVVDNLEHVLEAAPFLAELLAAAPGVKVLATSRAPLSLSVEHAYLVRPLAVPDTAQTLDLERVLQYDSVRLFMERARRVRRDFDLTHESAAEVASICARLDGLPLAIELAAARLRALTPTGLLARLDRRLPLLTGGDRDLPARQRTLRATIEWSYDLLRRGDRELFARLAVFAGGFTVDAVEGVCELDADPEARAVDGLTRLLDLNLIRASGEAGERFDMLETIREFGLELLETSGEEAVLRDRHAAYLLAFAEAKEAELRQRQSAILAQLEAEHENFRAALAWALSAGRSDTAVRLAATLWRFWWAHGFLTEGRLWLEQALGTGEEADGARARAMEGAATIAWSQGDSEAARGFAEASIAAYELLADRRGVARGLNNLGLAAQDAGDYEHARSYFSSSETLARELGNERGVGVALVNLGGLALIEGDYEAARRLSEQALALHRRLAGEDGIAISLLNLGFAALRQGRHDDAAEHVERSLEIFRKLGFREYAALCLEGLAAVECELGNAERAAQLLGSVEAACEAAGASLGPFERELHEQTLASVRSQLGEQDLETALVAGRAEAPRALRPAQPRR